MKRLAIITFISALLVLSLTHSVRAATSITFTDRALFLGAVINPIAFDFEVASGFPASPASLSSFAGGEVLLTTDNGDAAAFLNYYGSGFGQAIAGEVAGVIDAFKALRLTFTAPRFAVGFDDLDLTSLDGVPSELAIINVAFGNGAPDQQFSVIDADGDFSTAAFFGIISSDPIASIQVYSAEVITDPPGNRANVIDNVILAQVPDPSTCGLALIGLIMTLGCSLFRSRVRFTDI